MQRNKKAANIIKELAAQFLGKENNRTSLITVTECTCSSDLKRATIYITVMPDSKEHSVLHFVKRKSGELRKFLKNNLTTKNIPFVEIMIDRGEKNRQKIEELLRRK